MPRAFIFTEEQEEQITTLILRGQDPKLIAAKLEIGLSTVYKIRDRAMPRVIEKHPELKPRSVKKAEALVDLLDIPINATTMSKKQSSILTQQLESMTIEDLPDPEERKTGPMYKEYYEKKEFGHDVGSLEEFIKNYEKKRATPREVKKLLSPHQEEWDARIEDCQDLGGDEERWLNDKVWRETIRKKFPFDLKKWKEREKGEE